jgi:ribosomal-protein-alanine N-acetyltransferase
MRPADLEAVLAIERRSFAMPWSESTFRALMRRPSALLVVAEQDGVVAGFAVTWYAADEAELGDIAVLPELRGRGFGRALLEGVSAESKRRGARFLFLEVRESNERARSVYERAGFVLVGRRPGYYVSPREDAIVMRLDLYHSAR